MRRALMAWYRPRRQAYPWRMGDVDAYRVLVSEVMLQQTQAARVAPAFEAFVARFPTVEALAEAPLADVIRAWSGLGYNRRAVALSQAARAIVRNHGGRVPPDVDRLRALPGIGPYTASAVASIAFGARVPAIDTNVRRVVARAVLGREPISVSTKEVTVAARAFLDGASPGTWNQAVMDLGRVVCRPRPRCEVCPIARWCPSVSTGRRETLVRRGTGRRFEGSTREARGAVLDAVRGAGRLSVASVVARTGLSPDRVADAVTTLARDGLIAAGPAALTGRPTGRVSLPT
jgi:A/G-specific adenine glycosylase